MLQDCLKGPLDNNEHPHGTSDDNGTFELETWETLSKLKVNFVNFGRSLVYSLSRFWPEPSFSSSLGLIKGLVGKYDPKIRALSRQ